MVKRQQQDITYFTGGYTESNYSVTEEGLSKKALILVEGSHVDSKKRKHIFDEDRIYQIVENTNTLFNSGENIPVLKDHIKSFDSTCGSLESVVRVEVITEDNLPNKKAKHLIGKLGIFADEVLIKTKDAAEKVAAGIVKTISAGLDISTDTIREISLTSLPAILGMSLYHKSHRNSRTQSANFGDDSTSLTFEDLDSSDNDMEQIEEAYEELTEKLWTITKNIQQADDDLLDGADPMQLQTTALQEFCDRFLDLIGANAEQDDTEQAQDPRMNQPNQGQRPQATSGSRFNSNIPLASFPMRDRSNINFGIIDGVKSIGSKVIGSITEHGGSVIGGIKKDSNAVKRSFNAGNKVKGFPTGVGRAIKKIIKTKTGKIGLGTTAGVGAGLAAKSILGRKKSTTVVNNY